MIKVLLIALFLDQLSIWSLLLKGENRQKKQKPLRAISSSKIKLLKVTITTTFLGFV